MADEEENTEEGAEETAAASSGPSQKTIIIAVVGVVCVLFLVGAPLAYFALSKEEPAAEDLAAESAAAYDGVALEGNFEEDLFDEGEEPLGAFFPLDPFVVNLSGGGYVKLHMQIEFKQRDIPRRFYNRIVPIRDEVIATLASKGRDTVMSKRGRESLKTELRDVINRILRTDTVAKVYFTNFVVQ